MQTQTRADTGTINLQYLSGLDKSSLIDLLRDKTQQLVTARISSSHDQVYIKHLQKEVETIQAVIRTRVN
jgi:hypothetical protein